jgi:hypothetical protein
MFAWSSRSLLRIPVALSCALGIVVAVVIDVASYLPFDPEWTLNATVALFLATFVIGSVGAYIAAPALIRLKQWPTRLPGWFKWLAIAWLALTALWFLILLTLPGVPTHCGTLGQPPCGHEYAFNDHGEFIATDRAHFLNGVRILVRVFAAFPVTAFALVLVAYSLMATGKLQATRFDTKE